MVQDKRKVTFDFDGGLLTWDFFNDNQIDQLRADPVGTGVGLLNREARSIATGRSYGSYDGLALHPGSVQDLFIEIESLQGYHPDNHLTAAGTDMRAHVESGSTSFGAYGELPAHEIARTREMFVRVFAPETIVVPPMPKPLDLDPSFARAVHYVEEDRATLRSSRVIDLSNYTPPKEPPDGYDGVISLGPVS